MQHLNMSRSEVLNTPTYERRYYLELLKNSIEEKQEALEESSSSQSLGKGRRSKTITGDALKAKLKNNEIPNE